MKKILTFIAVIACVIMAAPVAHAAPDGSITFNGRLTDTTCTIDVNGGGTFGTVRLPTISAAELPSAGLTAAPTKFNITLTDCSGSSTQVLAYFMPDSTYVSASGNLKNIITDETGATNVELQLLDSTGAEIKVGDDSQHNGARTLITNNNATIQHSVQYYATDQVGPGLVEGRATYILIYP